MSNAPLLALAALLFAAVLGLTWRLVHVQRLGRLAGLALATAAGQGGGTPAGSEDTRALTDVPAPSGATRFPPGCRLLFADDLALNRLVLREFLAGTGAAVDEAADGAEVVAKVEASPPYHLVLLDLRMPAMDGFAAARAIRAREGRLGLRRVPLVALSASASAPDRRHAAEAGFDRFLAKPIDRAALLAALAEEMSPMPPLPNIPAGLEHMLPQFVAEMVKDAARLRELAAAPSDALAGHAHAVRGKCAMFGEDILYGLLSRLEEDARADRRDRRAMLIAEVVERVEQLKVYGPLP